MVPKAAGHTERNSLLCKHIQIPTYVLVANIFKKNFQIANIHIYTYFIPAVQKKWHVGIPCTVKLPTL